jgi:hypothetical protein
MAIKVMPAVRTALDPSGSPTPGRGPSLGRQSGTALSTVAATESAGCRFLELLAGQLAGLLDPAAELRLVQLVTLVNVEVADVALL